MTDEDTEQRVLKYLNSEDENGHGSFRSLTTLFEKVIGPSVPHADSYDVEDEIESKATFSARLDQMVSDGLLDSRWGERDYEASYRLTDQGRYEASGFDQTVSEAPSRVLATEAGEPITTEDGDYILLEDTPTGSDPQMTVESAAWTGLTKTIVDARNARVISRLIGSALDSLSASQAGNFETMQATAYLKAARELVDAPEPPSELIWQLISKAADVVGLIGLFYTIFSQAAR